MINYISIYMNIFKFKLISPKLTLIKVKIGIIFLRS